MEQNNQSTPTDANPAIFRLLLGVFSKPFLPVRLIVFLTFVILTDFTYGLFMEPTVYWLDYSRDTVFAVYKLGPFAAIGITLVYIAILWTLIRYINLKIAFPLWGGLIVSHLAHIIKSPPTCNYDMQQFFPAWLCQLNGNLITFVAGIILGAALALAWKNNEEHSPARLTDHPSFISKIGLSRNTVIIFTLWFLVSTIGVGVVSHIPVNGWKPIDTKNVPTARFDAMVAYNTNTSKGILFGGSVEISEGNWTKFNDTWEWNGDNWVLLNPSTSPSVRSRGAMEYDPKRNVIVLFGGWDNLDKSLNDTWVWDGKNWEEISYCESCYPPPARGCHNMFFDTVREEIVMYGGCNGNEYFLNDGWGWNGSQWESINIQDGPLASGSPIVYDIMNQRAIGFLSGQPTGTWVWDNNGWLKPNLAVEPPLRGNGRMAYDPKTGNILMFGGYKNNNNSMTLLSDTWVLNKTTWYELKSGLQPPGRWGHIVFFDKKLNKFILFGGFDGKNALNDLWGIDAGTIQHNK